MSLSRFHKYFLTLIDLDLFWKVLIIKVKESQRQVEER